MAKRPIKKKKQGPEVKPSQKPKLNKPEVPIQEVELDASGKVLGRLATQIANILRGKDQPAFTPNRLMGRKVRVSNASKIIITGNKLEQKKYLRHTGYLGHLKSVSLKEMMAKDPREVLRRAVYGMLPANKLRNKWMKNLLISN